MSRPFRYLRDPLFLACIGVYLGNRFVLKRLVPDGPIHAYVNDVLCIPFWVPLLLFAMRQLRLRSTDDPPQALEIILPLIVWTWLFELIFPAMAWFGPYSYADYHDVLAYAVGALGAALFWRGWYRPTSGIAAND